MKRCEAVTKYLGAFLDDELDAQRFAQVDEHLASCVRCQDEAAVQRAVSDGLRARFKAHAAPEDVRERARVALRKQQGGRGIEIGWLWQAVAVAAGVLIGVVASRDVIEAHAWTSDGSRDGVTGARAASTAVSSSVASGSGSSWVHDVISRHSRALPSDVEQAEQVERWFADKVPFHVRPLEFGQSSVRMTGARLSHVADRDAATLYYNVNGRRMTVVVFEPPDAWQQTGAGSFRVGHREFPYHEVRGYTVPIVNHNGLAYAITGDLDRSSLLRLAASMRLQ